MFFAVLMFGEAGAEILYPNPGFPIYESVINFTGATAVPIPLREDSGFSFSAEEDLRVLLVDADFVKPDALRQLGVSASKGLIDVLQDPQMDIADVMLRKIGRAHV